MAINKTDKVITLTDEGSGRGSSFIDPYTFEDLYNESVSEEWNPAIEKWTGGSGAIDFYYIPYKVINDAYFQDYNFNVLINNRDENDRYGWQSTGSGHTRFGINNFGVKSSAGCVLKIDNPDRNQMTLYNVEAYRTVISASQGVSIYSGCKFEHCIFQDCGSLYWDINADNEYVNCDVIGTSYGIIPRIGYAVNSGTRIVDPSRGILVGYNSNPVTLTELKIYNSDLCDIYYRANTDTDDNSVINLIDSIIDVTSYAISDTAEGQHTTLNLKSTFNAKIENASGGTLTIEDKDNNVVYTETLSSDSMTEQFILYYSRYIEMGANGISDGIDEENTYHPFTLKVTKSGYQDLEIPDITVTAGAPTTIFGKMTPIVVAGDNLTHTITEDSLIHTITEDILTHVITD